MSETLRVAHGILNCLFVFSARRNTSQALFWFSYLPPFEMPDINRSDRELSLYEFSADSANFLACLELDVDSPECCRVEVKKVLNLIFSSGVCVVKDCCNKANAFAPFPTAPLIISRPY